MQWIVLLPAEEASDSEAVGPYRTEGAARRVAARWLENNPNDPGVVIPLLKTSVAETK